MTNSYFVYLLASRINGTLYCGVTNDLVARTWQHKNDQFPGFTSKYHVHRLVWFEVHHDIEAAIQREKRIKKWNRAWKIQLIERDNPRWDDLYAQLANPSGVIPAKAGPMAATAHSVASMGSRFRGNDTVGGGAWAD